MIEVQDLTKKYGERTAVDRLSFKVEQGRIWGLLGPNAAGKTTTMRVLTGYLPATEGRAMVAGHDVFEEPDQVKRLTGYLPEVPPLYPDLTVSAYLQFVAELKQVPPARRKEAVERAVAAAGLEAVRDRLIRNISRGYKQRVGIAQALINDPRVLILDEPTIGLDPEQIIEIRQLIKSLRGERTIILSTHILAEVTQVCDGVVIINEGRLMASGALEELAASLNERTGVVLKVRKDGLDDRAGNVFRAIPGVTRVSVSGREVTVEWPAGSGRNEAVARAALAADLGLEEMRPLTLGIEDLYLKIISGGTER
jgi:ABC-2 type transport system ATP-binding protein